MSIVRTVRIHTTEGPKNIDSGKLCNDRAKLCPTIRFLPPRTLERRSARSQWDGTRTPSAEVCEHAHSERERTPLSTSHSTKCERSTDTLEEHGPKHNSGTPSSRNPIETSVVIVRRIMRTGGRVCMSCIHRRHSQLTTRTAVECASPGSLAVPPGSRRRSLHFWAVRPNGTTVRPPGC